MKSFHKDQLTIIAPKFFFRDVESIPSERYCMNTEAQQLRGFTIPSKNELFKANRIDIPDSLTNQLINQCNSKDEAFSNIQENEFIQLTNWLIKQIGSFIVKTGELPEAIIAWRDCKSLKTAAKEFGIKIIHNEYSVYREPDCRDRIIFDYSGFKSSRELHKRYRDSLKDEHFPWNKIENLVKTNFPFITADQSNKDSIGVLLGVEFDTAFSNGETNESLIARATSSSLFKNMLIRPHPIGDKKRNSTYKYDETSNLNNLIDKCSQVFTIFSGAAAELAAKGINVKFLGETPLKFLDFEGDSERKRKQKFGFFYYCYLVPGELLFDITYYRWRLTSPSEHEILNIHLEHQSD